MVREQKATPSRSNDPARTMLCRPEGGRAAGAVSARDREYVVAEVLDQWYGPDETFYKVCADDGNLYILRNKWRQTSGDWNRSGGSVSSIQLPTSSPLQPALAPNVSW